MMRDNNLFCDECGTMFTLTYNPHTNIWSWNDENNLPYLFKNTDESKCICNECIDNQIKWINYIGI